ncbi:MAG: hypothetical protein ACI4DP_03265 [Candidatus Ornithomonoglobus sp.]
MNIYVYKKVMYAMIIIVCITMVSSCTERKRYITINGEKVEARSYEEMQQFIDEATNRYNKKTDNKETEEPTQSIDPDNIESHEITDEELDYMIRNEDMFFDDNNDDYEEKYKYKEDDREDEYTPSRHEDIVGLEYYY